MRLPLAIIFCAILLCSCGFSGNLSRNAGISAGDSDALLANIRIERWGEMQFSGILALEAREETMSYVLLDATGVKLLEDEVNAAADRNGQTARGPLSESRLARVLSISLSRMFLLKPAEEPCSRQMLLSLCRKMTDEMEWATSYKAGPFLVWEVHEARRDAMDWNSVTYSQPWLGLRITVDKIN
jgi:hypothetical protein